LFTYLSARGIRLKRESGGDSSCNVVHTLGRWSDDDDDDNDDDDSGANQSEWAQGMKYKMNMGASAI